MSRAWLYNNESVNNSNIPEGSIGFIYKITNIETGMWYIGRKLLTKSATKVIKGKKKKIRKESDWEEYYSSSPYLKEIIEKEGKEKFKREILLFVNTQSSLTYSEEYALFVTGALFDPKCYNGNIRSKILRSWFGKTPDLHERLQTIKF